MKLVNKIREILQRFLKPPPASLHSVRTRLLLPFIVVSSVLIAGFSSVVMTVWENWQDRKVGALSDSIFEQLQVTKSREEKMLESLLLTITQNEDIKKHFKTKDKDHFYEEYRVLFDLFQKKYLITHLYFLDEDRECFLRVHNPEKSGDVINRITALEAQQKAQTISGWELGPLGTFTLRSVQPVLSGGEVVGYIELGKEIEDIFEILHKPHDVDIAVSIDKRKLNKGSWYSGMEMLGRESNWERFKDNVLIYYSLAHYPQELDRFVSRSEIGRLSQSISVDGKLMRIAVKALIDASATEVGQIIIAFDVTEQENTFSFLKWAALLAGLLLFLLLLLFFYKLLGLSDKNVGMYIGKQNERNEYFGATLQSIGDGVISVDNWGNVISLNKAAQELTGWSDKDARGKPFTRVFKIVDARDRSPAFNPVQKVLKTGETIGLANHTVLISKDGTERQIADSCAPIRSLKNEIIGAVLVFRDVTEEYRLREELKEQMNHVEFILKSTNTGLDIIDKDFNILYVNSEWKRVYGDPTGKKCYRYFRDADEPCPGCGVSEAIATKEIVVREHTLPKENNRIVECHTIPFENADGEWVVTEYKFDVTKRKKMEQELRENMNKLIEAEKIARLGRWELDCQSGTLTWTEGIYEIFEIDPDQFEPSYEAFLQTIHPDDRAAVDKAYKKSLENRKPYHIVHRLLFPDGRVKWVSEACRNDYDENGNPLRSVGTVQDITEQKIIDEEQKLLKDRLQATLHSMGDGVISTDKEGNVLSLNRMAEKFTGWSAEDAAGKLFTEIFTIVDSRDRSPAFNPVNEVLSTGKVVELSNHTVLIAKDGTERQIADSCAPVRGLGGTIMGAVLVFRDVTEEYMLREDLKKRTADLQERVKELKCLGEISMEIDRLDAGYSLVMQRIADLIPEAMFYNDDACAQITVDDQVYRSENFKDTAWCIRKDIFVEGRSKGELKVCYHQKQREDSEKMFLPEEEELIELAAQQLKNFMERRVIREAIQNKNELFELSIRGSRDGLWDWDLRTNKLYLSPAWKEMIGYEDHELENEFSTFERFLHPEDMDRVKNYVLQYLGGDVGVYNVEFRYQHKDGSYRWIEARGEALRDESGRPFRMAGSHRDITERKETEMKLLLAKEEWERTFNAVPDLIAILDKNHNIVRANRAMVESMKHPASELLGASCFKVVHGENCPPGFCPFSKTLQDGLTHTVELDIPQFGGVFAVTASPLMDEKGELLGCVHIARDITERKKNEQNLLETNMELEEATARANFMAAQAEMANAAKSQFLANMSHEIRTPMNGVIGMAELLLDTPLTEEQKTFTQMIQKSGDSLLRLINDILDLSRIEAGKFDMELMKFHLRVCIEDTLDLLEFRAHDKGIELILMIEPDVPSDLIGDPGRLRQVITNLVGNAIKFTDEGKVEVVVRLERETEKNVSVRFEIDDTGIGIPKSKQKLLFSPFTQIDGSATRKYGGTGLGLVISKRICELMGGKIGVESKSGQGSKFWFTVQFEKVNPEDVVDLQPVAGLEGVKVLVVDDQETNRYMICALLKKWGCVYDEADGAQSALELMHKAAAQKNPYKIALLDMQMPGTDGFGLAKEILGCSDISQTILVMMTSVCNRGDAKKFRNAGFYGYITKPLRERLLRETMSILLSNKEGALGEKEKLFVTRHTVSESQKRRKKILLAEDNKVNQIVALRMVEKLGFTIDAVNNGREALDALKTGDYGMLFMDIQMPEMDGVEALKLIRSGKAGEKNRAIPVVAMTAHAMKQDRKKYMDRGMNDYISKPISADVLSAVIEKWINNNENSDQQEKRMSIESEEIDSRRVLNTETFMDRMMDDKELATTVSKIFVEEFPSLLEQLQKLADDDSLDAVSRQAHKIKGSAGNVSAERISFIAQAIELSCKRGDGESVDRLTRQMGEEFEELKVVLGDFLG